jgi:cytochrome c553
MIAASNAIGRGVAFAALVAACAAPAVAQDIGAEKAKQVCAACHGDDGNGKKEFPDYPKLAGQYEDYLYHSLKAYKTGARKNAIMAGMAQPLSDAEMRALARYFSKQQSSLTVTRDTPIAAK